MSIRSLILPLAAPLAVVSGCTVFFDTSLIERADVAGPADVGDSGLDAATDAAEDPATDAVDASPDVSLPEIPPAPRPCVVELRTGANQIRRYAFTYNPQGAPTLVQTRADALVTNPETWTLGYDPSGTRLVSVAGRGRTPLDRRRDVELTWTADGRIATVEDILYDRDGDVRTRVSWQYGTGETLKTVLTDAENDGVFETRTVQRFDARFRTVRIETDIGNNSSVNRVESWRWRDAGPEFYESVHFDDAGRQEARFTSTTVWDDLTGRPIRAEIDVDGDNVADGFQRHVHDVSGRLLSISTDADDDGTVEEISTILRGDGGDKVVVDMDPDDDGRLDRRVESSSERRLDTLMDLTRLQGDRELLQLAPHALDFVQPFNELREWEFLRLTALRIDDGVDGRWEEELAFTYEGDHMREATVLTRDGAFTLTFLTTGCD